MTAADKRRARSRLHYALAHGHITRGTCEVDDDCEGRIEAHHDDYSRPLDVRWLCQMHHYLLHRWMQRRRWRTPPAWTRLEGPA